MKTSTTCSGHWGVEPPDTLPLRRQAQHLLLEYRRFRLRRWLVRRAGFAAQGIAKLLALAGLVFLLAQSGTVLRWVDPTVAVIDIGALSLVLLAVVALAQFLAVSRWLIGLLWPVLREYQKNHFSNNFKSLFPWQKITFYLVIFFGFVYAFVCCLVAVY